MFANIHIWKGVSTFHQERNALQHWMAPGIYQIQNHFPYICLYLPVCTGNGINVILEENLYLFNNARDHGGQVWTWGSLYAFNAQEYIKALGCIHLRFEFLSVIILHLIFFSSSLSKFPNFLFDIFCPFAFPHLIVFEFFVHKWYS